jgi:hypothetical protein
MHTNSLINQKSPYLLQHAHNPVDWFAWSNEAFEKAKAENKLVLVSVGYSSCHWCHVMERECFEDEEVANLMNEHFINIKVDREERPDVDHVYMTAVQLMSGHGGWPLNCFTLPDGRPVYGGTYFPKQQWMDLLKKLVSLYKENRAKTEEYATELTGGIRQVNELVRIREDIPVTKDILETPVTKWRKRFDIKNGGTHGAPKFPMPNNWLFLLRYGSLTNDEELVDHIHFTLEKMARGGIYDQLGGGFARYSTDAQWKVPHFEKMLYDNAQLISLYSEAYRNKKNELYKQVVYDTIAFLQREMMYEKGGFYSAFDADSEGVEGLFYTWTKEELQELLKKDFNLFADYFSVNEEGHWEDERYILLRTADEETIAAKHKLTREELHEAIQRCREKLMKERDKRVRPGLDDKIITSWNGLMCAALCDAYQTFGKPGFLAIARKNIEFIQAVLQNEDGSLCRTTKATDSYGEAFLDDYAFVMNAFLALFCSTGEEKFQQAAEKLGAYCFTNFFDKEKGLFSYASAQSQPLISGNFEVHDNVIPGSNSQMALNLHLLHQLAGVSVYGETARQMLAQMSSDISSHLPSFSNWALLALRTAWPFYEVCVVGKDVDEFRRGLSGHYHPNAIFVYSKQSSDAALLKDRFREQETLAYVCTDQSCKQPASSVQEAIKQLG